MAVRITSLSSSVTLDTSRPSMVSVVTTAIVSAVVGTTLGAGDGATLPEGDDTTEGAVVGEQVQVAGVGTGVVGAAVGGLTEVCSAAEL